MEGGASTPPGQYRSGSSRNRYGGSSGGTSTVITGTGGKSISLAAEAKQGWIIAKASPDDMAEIGRWIERLDQAVTTVTADTPLSTIENKNQVVQKCIKLESYSPSQMGEIILPLLSESGYVSADESTGNLLVIDTVENLMRVEAIVAQFDVPEAEQTTTQVFDMQHADPAEVVQLLRMLLSDGIRPQRLRQWLRRAVLLSFVAWVLLGQSALSRRQVRLGQLGDHGAQLAAGRADPRAQTQVDHRPGFGGGHEAHHRLDRQARPGRDRRAGVRGRRHHLRGRAGSGHADQRGPPADARHRTAGQRPGAGRRSRPGRSWSSAGRTSARWSRS